MAKKLEGSQTVLAVFAAGEDRALLDNVFGGSDWKLRYTRTLAETQAALHRSPVEAVLSEGHLCDGYSWRDVLHELQNTPNPPPLIVVDRLADERLWAEVLNLGGYDVLMKPFDARELFRAVSMACRFCENQRERTSASSKPLKPAEQSRTETIAHAASGG